MFSPDIEKLGFGNWFQDRVNPADLKLFEVARVVAIHKDSYTVNNGEAEALAELVGKMVFDAASPLDYPAVGDWVLATFHDRNTFAVIHRILPRKSLLKRKAAGRQIDFQLIAANVDTAFIVQALDRNFNLNRLERYLVMVQESHIQPVVLLSKCDLIESEEITRRVAAIHDTMPALPVQPFSNQSEYGLPAVKDFLSPRQTFCVLGSSGVGKTTLINRLIGKPLYATRAVRAKDGKGRHATTHRQLLVLDSQAMLIDTPGMRELGTFSVETGIRETFADISELTQHCQFSDCSHLHEKGCAVRMAVEEGALPEKRYQNYLKLQKENAFHERSYLERKKEDKRLGKLYKSILQQKKNRR